MRPPSRPQLTSKASFRPTPAGALTGADRPKSESSRPAATGTLPVDEIDSARPGQQETLTARHRDRRVRPVGSIETQTVQRPSSSPHLDWKRRWNVAFSSRSLFRSIMSFPAAPAASASRTSHPWRRHGDALQPQVNRRWLTSIPRRCRHGSLFPGTAILRQPSKRSTACR